MLPRMPCIRTRPLVASSAAAAFAFLITSCSNEVELARPDVAPVVLHEAASPTDNDATDGGRISEVRGRVLLGELGCTGCHDADASEIEHRSGPDLHTVGARVYADYLTRFLASPHAIDPGTTMPDLLRHLDPEAARTTATALSHYLRSFAPTSPQASANDEQAAQRGQALFDTIGCRTCHPTSERRLLPQPKYSTKTLADFLLAPHEVRPDGRMPSMALSPAEAFDLAAFLLSGSEDAGGPVEPIDPSPIEPELVDDGRRAFASLGCSHCHALSDPQRPDSAAAKPLRDLQPGKGCLSNTTGTWPHYHLTPSQTRDIQNALANIDRPLAGEARVQQLMASRNCFVCHRRGDLDLISAHEDNFSTLDATIGQDGRVPPTLTGVGGKLQESWLHNTIGHGQKERPYLVTRMPGFGDEFATKLTAALTAVDEVPDVKVTAKPKNRKEAEAVKKLGRELVGDKGMNCITCHYFAGEKAGAMGAIDLVHSTGKRLRPEWFSAFLRNPFEFKPITLMPEFYPNGKSTRPEIADGDPQRQIDAMWHYLAAGRNVGKPPGMRYPPIELEVTDQAVMLRRSVRDTGKRGISVGYPGGVNLTFDAEKLGLNQIWWGRFVDARPVWTGQGSGQANVLSRQRSLLANGPAFARIEASQPWPTQTRRDRGDRFFGYELDQQKRPTFRYTADKVTVEDKPEQVVGDGKTILQRTMTLSGEGPPLQFLAARHKQIEGIDERTFRVGKHLHIKTGDHPATVQTFNGEQELRVQITLDQSPTTVVLNYSWHQEEK